MKLRDVALDLPIIQAPMAGVQDHHFVLVVCEAGALGSLPGAMFSVDTLRSELSLLAAKTSRPFNVNFFCHPAPTPDPAREARWCAALLPYYRELGLDQSTILHGGGRRAFDDETADVVEEFRPAI